MLLNDDHKNKLLKISQEHPADIASLLDYLEEKLDLLPSAIEEKDKDFFKFCLVKSFSSEISTLNKEENFKDAAELLKELKELWKDLFGERARGKKEYIIFIGTKCLHTELDFGVNDIEDKNPLGQVVL